MRQKSELCVLLCVASGAYFNGGIKMKRTFKKSISLFLATLIFIGTLVFGIGGWSGLTVNVNAEDAATSGKCGDNLTWNFDESTNTLTISGTGEMWDYEAWENDSPWTAGEICSEIKTIKITEGVTSIGKDAFVELIFLKTVELPNTLNSIGEFAFQLCYNMESIEIPDSVTTIEYGAFNECQALKSVKLPSNITSIESYVFGQCYSLESITIPENVTSIGDAAFVYCESLSSINIPASVTSIGHGAFYACDGLSNITVDSENTAYISDEYGALFNKDKTLLIKYPTANKRTEYNIPYGVKEIESSAFENGKNLTKLTIPDTVVTIGIDAFLNCAFGELTIPDSVTSIGAGAFVNNKFTEITIPDGITQIDRLTFSICQNLKSVTLPDSLTSVEWSAFSYCENITDVYYEGSVEEWRSIKFEDGNECLTNATIHYNFSIEDEEETTRPSGETTTKPSEETTSPSTTEPGTTVPSTGNENGSDVSNPLDFIYDVIVKIIEGLTGIVEAIAAGIEYITSLIK